MSDELEIAEARANALLRMTELFGTADLERARRRLERDDLAGFYKELGISFDEGERLRLQLHAGGETKSESLNPVKDPFSFVQRVVDLEPGKRIVATGGLRYADRRVAGHLGTLPGTLQLEALAQASAIAMRAGSGKSRAYIPLCARIENAQFERVVGPGEELQLEATLRPTRQSFGWAEVRASVSGQTSVSARLTLYEDGLRLRESEAIPQPGGVDVPASNEPPPDTAKLNDEVLLPSELEERSLLPGSEPFILLDSAQVVEAGQKAVSSLRVNGEEWFLQGHFPGFQVLPGMMQLEALAQTSAIALLSDPRHRGSPVCVSVPLVRFTRIVRPGEELTLEATVEPLGGPFHSAGVRGWVDGEIAVDGEIVLYLNGSLAVGSALPQPPTTA